MEPGTSSHVCSVLPYACDSCGYAETRDAFECFIAEPDGSNSRFAVICPECEAFQKDDSNWDLHDCDACTDEWED